MATGRIGVTPTLGVRWSKAPASGTTSLSGLDDNSVSLVYSVGYEQVYRNGVLLSRGNDYTATTGTTVTLIDATITGDIIEIFAQQLVPLTDAISKGQFTAKGTLLSATAASTPGVLAVGANDTILTADSTTATGLKWAAPAASGGMTLISTTTFSNTSSLTLSSIPQTYKHLYLTFSNIRMATNNQGVTLTNVGGGGISATWVGRRYDGANFSMTQLNSIDFGYINGSNLFGVFHGPSSTVTRELGFGDLLLPNYTEDQAKFGFSKCAWVDGSSGNWRSSEIWANLGANNLITSMVFGFSANVTSGTLRLYGVS
jgi:hypothetical protein